MSIRFLMGMLLALCFSASNAQTPITATAEYRIQFGATVSNWDPLRQITCTHFASLRSAAAGGNALIGTYRPTPGDCSITYSNGVFMETQTFAQRFVCGTTVVTAGTVCQPTCPAGQTRTQTWSVGWSATATPTGNEPLITPPTEYCDGSCLAMFASIDAAGVDTSPSANGSYEMTADATYSTTGQTCTTQTPQPPVPDPPPPADGGGDGDGDGDGDPNGDPDPDLDPGDGPADPTDSDGDGIPDSEEPGDDAGDGGSSSVTCTLTQQELGACSCTAEQQAAGSCSTGPASGSCTREQSIAGLCSCTTPTGAATACSGGSGGGDPNAPDTGSEAVCGGPGLPACTVQILEAQAYDGGKYVDKISEVAKTIENAIDNDSTYWNKVKTYLAKTAAELTGWTWTFTLPTGCTPFVMAGYGLSIDVCQFQPMIHDIMGLLWSLATIGFLIRLFLWGID